jgi:hypothetical protein
VIDEEAIKHAAEMQAVYRMFDANGELLYVGVSANMGVRIAGHSEKRWFPLVTTIRLEWFPTRAAAEAAEAKAIRTERPQINIAGQPRSALARRRAPGAPRAPIAYDPDEALKLGSVSLSEAVSLRVLRCTLGAARMASHRPGFPPPIGKRDRSNLYDVAELQAFASRRNR